MHHPDPGPTPPPGESAAGQAHSRGRRPRPGPPGFTYEVQLLGGEAGRRLAQEQTEAIAALLAWLAAHASRGRVGGGRRHARRAETGDADREAAGPAESSRAAGASTQRGTGGGGGVPTPEPNEPGPSGGPGGLEGGGSWSRDPTAVRVHAVGLVGAGRPVGEVARALGVHPAALRRWVWHAWRGWGTAMGLTQSDSPDPSADRSAGQARSG
jgi:Transposase